MPGMKQMRPRRERGENGSAPSAIVLLWNVRVLGPDRLRVCVVDIRRGRKDGEVRVAEQRAGAVGPSGFVALGEEHEPGNLADDRGGHAEPCELAPRERSTLLFIVRAGRLVDGIVIPGGERGEVPGFIARLAGFPTFGRSELSDRVQDLLQMRPVVIAPVWFGPAREQGVRCRPKDRLWCIGSGAAAHGDPRRDGRGHTARGSRLADVAVCPRLRHEPKSSIGGSTPSWASSQRFMSRPPPKPPKPSLATTRWQGTTIG